MKSFWIEFVEPGGRSGGSESSESASFLASRRFLSEYDAKGLPAAVVLQPFERNAAQKIVRRHPARISFNRLGKQDAAVSREAARLKDDLDRFESVARALHDPIDAKEWRAGIARLNMRARTKAIASKKPASEKPATKKKPAAKKTHKRVSPKFEQWLKANGYRRTRSGWLSPDGKKFFPL